MILTCPACATRFVVDPRSLGADGRKVRCARCRHIWFATAPDEALRAVNDLAPPPAPPAAAVPDAESSVEPAPPPRPTPRANLPARRRAVPRGLVVGWAALILVAIGLAAMVYDARDDIAAAWPATRRLYDLLDIAVAEAPPLEPAHDTPVHHPEVPGAGLEAHDLEPELVTSAGTLVLRLRGRVVNVSAEPRTVPSLRATLMAADGRRLRSWTFQTNAGRLAPGESARFETVLNDPSRTADRLEITVAEEAAAQH